MSESALTDGIVAVVTFEKKAGSENYGNETASVSIHLRIPEGIADYDVPETLIASALAAARRLVHGELACSPSAQVVRSLEPTGRRVPITTTPPTADTPTADLEELPF